MHQKNNLHAQCSNLQNAGDRLSCSRCVFLLKRNSCQIQLPQAQLRDKAMCSNNPATLLKDSYTQGMLLVSYASHTRPKTDAARACRKPECGSAHSTPASSCKTSGHLVHPIRRHAFQHSVETLRATSGTIIDFQQPVSQYTQEEPTRAITAGCSTACSPACW